MKDIRIAAAVSTFPPLRIQENMERMERMVRDARARGAEIVCFPEMNITGYTSVPEIRMVAEAIPGPLSDRLLRMAEAEQIVILAGMAEKAPDDRVYASHLVVCPEGDVSVYRKLHVAPPEKEIFAPGSDIPLFDACGMRFGIQLCYDAHFPELTTLMTQKGADLIFFPHASPRGTPEEKYRSWRRHLPARAYDNSIFVVACNPTGKTLNGIDFPGIALAIDPSGNIMETLLTDREGLLIVDLPARALDRVRNHKMRFFFPNRRPNLYARAGDDSSS